MVRGVVGFGRAYSLAWGWNTCGLSRVVGTKHLEFESNLGIIHVQCSSKISTLQSKCTRYITVGGGERSCSSSSDFQHSARIELRLVYCEAFYESRLV